MNHLHSFSVFERYSKAFGFCFTPLSTSECVRFCYSPKIMFLFVTVCDTLLLNSQLIWVIYCLLTADLYPAWHISAKPFQMNIICSRRYRDLPLKLKICCFKELSPSQFITNILEHTQTILPFEYCHKYHHHAIQRIDLCCKAIASPSPAQYFTLCCLISPLVSSSSSLCLLMLLLSCADVSTFLHDCTLW